MFPKMSPFLAGRPGDFTMEAWGQGSKVHSAKPADYRQVTSTLCTADKDILLQCCCGDSMGQCNSCAKSWLPSDLREVVIPKWLG